MVGRTLSLVVLVLVSVVTLLFGLWPLNFLAQNGVRWLSGQNGIEFYKGGLSPKRAVGGIVYSHSPVDIESESNGFEPSTIELFVESNAGRGDGLAHVMSFHDGYPRSSLVIGQWKSYLIIRARDNRNAARDTYREIDLKGGLAINQKKLITVASGPDRTDIYVDGELANSCDVRELIGVGHFCGYLNLGNSSVGQSAWAGRIYGLAIYGKLLTPEQIRQHYVSWTDKPTTIPGVEPRPLLLYTFAERAGSSVHNQVGNANHLTIPSSFKPLRTAVVVRFWREVDLDWNTARDVLVNIVGFTPFACSLLMFLTVGRRISPRNAAVLTLLAGAGLSIAIEAAQTGLPTRTPSLLDVVCNTAGTALGIMAFRTAMRTHTVWRVF